MPPPDAPPVRRRGGAIAVGAGIFASRIAGLVRERAFAHYLGLSKAADAFNAALRIPNVLQNLLGEGVLSASFIPVYARLLAEGKHAEASRVARAVATLLVAGRRADRARAASSRARWLVDVLAPGFQGDERELTIDAGPHPVPGRRAARAVGVVPRRAQQPSPILPQLRVAGGVERGADRRGDRRRAPAAPATTLTSRCGSRGAR